MSKKPAGHPGFERALEAALEEADKRDHRIRVLDLAEEVVAKDAGLLKALKARGVMPKSPYRSQLEQDRSNYHEMRRLAGEIHWWGYECWSFHLGGKAGSRRGVKYTPDFFVLPLDFFLTIEDTKAYIRRGEKEKMKLAAAMFPFKMKIVTREEGEWKEEELN